MNNLIKHITLSMVACVLLVSCGDDHERLRVQADPEHPGRYVCRFEVMGTNAGVMVGAEDKDAARQMIMKAISRVKRVNRLMSTYRGESDISRINDQAAEGAIKVDDKTLHVLRAAKDFYRLTDGAFDITYAPLRQVWRRASANDQLPSDKEIEKALKRVSTDNLILRDDAVHLAVSGMELDLGGIAKGYAADEAVRALRKAGAESALVDIGGDMRLLGTRRGGQKWRVKVRDPRPETHDPLILRLTDEAVATSGDYVRFFRIEDQRFSHIIDPRTGRPARMVPSATVIAPTAILADALATALSLLDTKEALELVNSLDNVECFLMTRNRPEASESIKTHYSDGFLERVQQ